MKIEFKQEAKAEIVDSFFFYEGKRIGLGKQFINELEQILQLISLSPGLFPKHRRGLKKAIIRRFPFIIIFEIEKAVITIYAVFHTSRNLAKRI